MRDFEMPVLLYNLSRAEMQSNYGKFGNWTPKVKGEMLAQLAAVEEVCRKSGLSTEDAAHALRERVEQDDAVALGTLGTLVGALRNNIIYEIKRLHYLEIPRADVDLYKNPRPFGDDVWTKFSDARDDLEEAAKCLALDRGTACVMHLTRAMEHALRAFGASLGLTFKLGDDWQDMLDAIEPVLKPMTVSQRKDAYRQAHADLGRVKLAWRLPAFHSRGSWTPAQAREVFGSCRAFMQHVATVT